MTTLLNIAAPPSPYKGLAPFDDTELDAFLFFGRAWETEVVSANALASRLTVLYGPSGVGKSSLLRAGVVRALRAEPGLPRPAVAYYGSWAGAPLTGLQEASRGAVAHALGREPADAPGELADQLAAWSAELGGEVCLLLDQLEELFLYHPGEGAGGFVDLLPELVGRPGLRVNVLLGIRDDALSQLDVFKRRIPALFGNSLRLDHLDREAGRAAILGPLANYSALAEEDIEVEPELVESVLDEVAAGRIEPGLAGRGSVPGKVAGSRIETPYLQLVLQRIWEVERERGSTVLRLDTFRGLGGAERIVEDHLERALHALTPPEQDAAASVFGHLVTPSGTKIAHGVSDLASYAEVGERELEPVLRSLAGQRILRPLGENGHAGGRYEIFHDVLADAVLAWRTRHDAEAAIASEREAARRRQRRLGWLVAAALVGLALMTALAAYAFSQRSEAREQAVLASEQQTEAEKSANAASLAAAEATRLRKKAEEQERVARVQATAAKEARDDAVVARRAALEAKETADVQAAIAQQSADSEEEQARLAEIARDDANQAAHEARTAEEEAQLQARKAERQRARAVALRKEAQARELVARSLATLATDPERSARLALRASELFQGKATEDALRGALVALHVQHIFPHAGPKPVARFSVNGRRLVTGGGSRQVRVYTSRGNRLRTFRSEVVVNDVALNRDGTLGAAAGVDGRARVWNVNSGELVRTVEHEGSIATVAWSPTEDVLVTAGGGRDPSARLWNTATGDLLQPLSHTTEIRRVSFSHDGTRLVTVGREKSAHVYDVGTGVLLATLEHPSGQITSAAFGPGNIVVTGGTDRRARIWEASGELRHPLAGHTSDVLDVAVSPNGDFVATASLDSLGRVFSAETGGLVDTLHDHGGPPVYDVDFSPVAPTGQSWAVVTAGGDKTARYWAPGQQPVVLLGHDGRVSGASFSPDGGSVLTASRDGSARLWDFLGDRALQVLDRRPESVRVTSVAVNAAGSQIASGDNAGLVRVISPDGRILRTLPKLARPIETVAWSKGGRLLAASRDGVAQVWGQTGDQPLATVRHGGLVQAAALSADGTLVATAGDNGLVRIWPVSGGSAPTTLDAPGTGVIASVEFDPAGRRVASASGTFTHMWQLGTGELTRLGGHEESVTGMAFDATGALLATSSSDRDARVWTLKTRDSMPFVGHGGTVFDVAFSADSRWLATASLRKAGVWQVGNSDLPRNFLFFLAGHGGQLTSVAFSPRDWTVVTGSIDGTVRSYRCSYCGRLKQLIPIAKARLDRLTAERNR